MTDSKQEASSRRGGRGRPLANSRSPIRTQWSKIAPYALIALFSFLCGAALLVLMIWKAEKLTALGLTGNVYYIVLFPLGLSAGAFFFGVLRSYASYSGKHPGGALELSGPIVAGALVVIGAYFFVPGSATFGLTVYVHGEGGPHELVLRNSGYVVMDLGPDRRREPIGEKGQSYFPAIPANFRGQEVLVWVESENFESVGAGQKRRLEGSSLYLPVRKKSGRIFGRVQDQNGNPIPGAEIRVAGLSSSTDTSGHFEINIPGDRLEPELDLQAVASGYAPKNYTVVPNANELAIILTRVP